MDKARLVETACEGTAGHGGERPLAPEEVGRVFDAVFGTVERPGAIARALRAGETVSMGSFGSFRSEDGTAAFRPGTALTEYLRDRVR
ncbi:hypothetical protein [Streptomyces griseoviridis]|uniref:DNA-binding protein HU-beta n=1 Tax=Streptomyces griseoviridis TaxID=45398 RepID=A0ABT9LRJ7_STRGD|nr:hypothetical protein [Streptomyces griseoviridis]MDP9686167.1 DNA-binding protein HU-beta [Streptomyces griseoviridis]GGS79858.1 hypothetical protein GCM10010240_11580 [Streptomyces griseoviridis]